MEEDVGPLGAPGSEGGVWKEGPAAAAFPLPWEGPVSCGGGWLLSLGGLCRGGPVFHFSKDYLPRA